MKEPPNIIHGGQFTDERGKLIFFNDFDMKEVKRFYIIEHPDTSIVRAWQGHKIEKKWFHVISGSFKVGLVQPDNWEKPSPELKVEEFILRAGDNSILFIPGNYANGFKAMEPGSGITVFSSFSVEESAADNYRFDKSMWYNWQQI